ncbi:MAG: peptidoglycan DD-metalloendopeptidase family protein [Anaerolineae bacterium]|nr:peptidoglycan DD-metalloendopeptidase family protein [Anaerolineae bacterium]
MSDCRKIRRLLAVQSTNWSADEQAQVEAHLDTCPNCSALAQVYAEQDRLIRSLPRAGLTPAQRGQFLSQIQQERKRHKMLRKPLAILGTVAAALVFLAMGLGVQTLLENGQPTPATPATRSPTAAITPQKMSVSTIELVWPVEGHITQPYSPEHRAIDIAAEEGSPVVAAAAGTVAAAEWDDRHGNLVAIDHGDGLITRYTHLLDYQVEVGDPVDQGQQIGRVGSTGESTGPHLHFEMILKIDPTPLLNKDGQLLLTK